VIASSLRLPIGGMLRPRDRAQEGLIHRAAQGLKREDIAPQRPERILGLPGIQGPPGESRAAPGSWPGRSIPPEPSTGSTATAGPWIAGASRKGQRSESNAFSRDQAPPWARCAGPAREKSSASTGQLQKPASSERNSFQCSTGWGSIRVH
jgi:hypothetical protein